MMGYMRGVLLILGVCASGVAWAKGGDKPASEAPAKDGPLEVEVQLYSRFGLTDAEGEPDAEFAISRARLELTFRPARYIEAVLETEFDEAFEAGSSTISLLKDAYVDLTAFKWLKIQAGQFKRPFSLLELSSKGKLPVVNRGLSSEYMVRGLDFGSRDIGVQVHGRLLKTPRLRYYVGVFNGSGANDSESDLNGAKDLVGRLEFEPLDWLEIGAGASLKQFDRNVSSNEDRPESAWMAGLDAKIRIDGLEVMAEGMYGVNYDASDHPGMWAVYGLATYRIPLGDGFWAIQPVLRAEYMVPDVSDGNGILLLTAGANLRMGEHVRLMLDGEWTRPASELELMWPETKAMWLQLAFDWP